MSWASIRAAILMLLWLVSCGLAQTTRPADPAPVDIDDMPLKGAPVGRPQSTVGAGARQGNEGLPEVFVLAPPETGATTKPQPVIYWYLTGPTGQDIEMTLAEIDNSGRQGRLVKSKKLSGRQKAGVYSFNLASEGVTLQLDQQYQITVTVKKSDENVSNPHSIAFIALVSSPAGLGDHPDARAFAASGLWYDAVDWLVAGLKKDPASVPTLRQLCGLVWSQHVFYRKNEKIDAAAQERAKVREREWMKQFDAVKWDLVKS